MSEGRQTVRDVAGNVLSFATPSDIAETIAAMEGESGEAGVYIDPDGGSSEIRAKEIADEVYASVVRALADGTVEVKVKTELKVTLYDNDDVKGTIVPIGTLDVRVDGLEASVGTLGLASDGRPKIKTGPNNTDWTDVAGPASIVVIFRSPEAGDQCDVPVPFDCVITKAVLTADQSGDIVIDIWKDDYDDFPPTDADSITASAPPTLSSAIKAKDTTLTGWTKAISDGDVLRFNVDSVSGIGRATITLTVDRI